MAPLFALAFNQSVTNVVLPKPAGAEIKISLRSRLDRSNSISRGLGTRSGREGGMNSFVTRIESAID
mgnify:CR=1 FL=1